MIRTYPVEKPTTAPGTGHQFYLHLLHHIGIPAQANHNIWYGGEKQKLAEPDKYAFRGCIPAGTELELKTLNGKPIMGSSAERVTDRATINYKFSGNDGPVLVLDLSDNARDILKIPDTSRPQDKVFNPNFKPYGELDKFTRWSNELASLSFVKCVSNYFGGKGKLNYSEKDVLNFVDSCLVDLSSPEMDYLTNGNNLLWCGLAYQRNDGNINGDIELEFHAQNPTDFYMKDVGTLLPSMLYAVANLGQDPVEYHDKIDVTIWGARDAAEYMRQYLPKSISEKIKPRIVA